jgi:tRNA modification GTPase
MLAEAADILIWLGEAGEAPGHRRTIRVQAKCDLPGRQEAPEGVVAVSALAGEGVRELMQAIADEAASLLPAEGAVALNRRQATELEAAADALSAAARAGEVVLVAEGLRVARGALDRLTGRAGLEDLLDALFGRFCLGK